MVAPLSYVKGYEGLYEGLDRWLKMWKQMMCESGICYESCDRQFTLCGGCMYYVRYQK